MNLMLGDCLETLRTLPDNSVDSVVTDPPYGLSFMGKKWDYDVPSTDIWKEVLRVLKPGGHVLSFCGTRTYHRMVVNMEDAGFEIRDQIQWIYGSGFPKSMDVSKAIDKAAGAEREVVGLNKNHRESAALYELGFQGGKSDGSITAPSTDLAKQWQGWGTALKPANEPICLARKPLEGTVAKNFENWGVGGLNINASRIGTEMIQGGRAGRAGESSFNVSIGDKPPMHQGRWPANVLFDEEAASVLDEQAPSTGAQGKSSGAKKHAGSIIRHGGNQTDAPFYADSGGASRFFYVAKASKRERNAGLEGMPQVTARSGMGGTMPVDDDGKERDRFSVTQANHHPTVKPIKLMQYLVRMITPPGGTVLDPFMGSGSTGCAARSLGFEFIGCELSEEYLAIAERRIKHHEGEAV